MEKKRIQLEISNAGLKDLLKLKDQLYVATMADAIRSSLKIVKKLEEEKKAGSKIIIVDKNNNQREIEFI